MELVRGQLVLAGGQLAVYSTSNPSVELGLDSSGPDQGRWMASSEQRAGLQHCRQQAALSPGSVEEKSAGSQQ